MEQHPFIELPDYQVSHILLGSFSCLKNGQYGEWFYLGSGKSNFWRLMENVYEQPVPTKADKVALVRKQGIWITDIAKTIERKKEDHGCLDANLRILEYNTEMIQQVLNEHPVKSILCTSAWVAELFVKKMQPLLAKGTPIPEVIKLPSPSPMADQAIRANADYKAVLAQNPDFTPWAFRLEKFKASLPKV
jgi:uncharacterized protein YqcC (DUF446 family)